MNHHASSLMMRVPYAPMNISLSPTSVSGSSSSSTVTTNSSTLTITGGSGNRTINWAQISGGSVSINGVTNFYFSTSSLSPGGNVSGSWQVTVTDTTTGEVKQATINFSMSRTVPALSISLSGSGSKTVVEDHEVNVQNDGVTINGSGGYPPYSYNQTKLSGDFTLSGSQTAYASRLLQPQGGVSGNVRATLYDSNSGSTSQDYSVVLINNGQWPPGPSLSPDATFAYGISNNSLYVTTQTINVTRSGGTAPFTINWNKTGGMGSANSPNSLSSSFSNVNQSLQTSEYGTFRLTVTDANYRSATVDINAQFDSISLGG